MSMVDIRTGIEVAVSLTPMLVILSVNCPSAYEAWARSRSFSILSTLQLKIVVWLLAHRNCHTVGAYCSVTRFGASTIAYHDVNSMHMCFSLIATDVLRLRHTGIIRECRIMYVSSHHSSSGILGAKKGRKKLVFDLKIEIVCNMATHIECLPYPERALLERCT